MDNVDYIMVTVAVATLAALIIGFAAEFRRKRDQGGEDEGGWYDGRGNGGWTDKPSGGTPRGGGPDRDMDKQFNEIANAIGKTVVIEKNEGEKVLT